MKQRGRAWTVKRAWLDVRSLSLPLICPYLAEVELEEAWLAEAGLSSLVTEEDTPLSAEVLLSTLTRQQAATVRKRLDKYTETLKSRNRQPVKDVRDIFTEIAPPTWTQTQTVRRVKCSRMNRLSTGIKSDRS